MKKYIALGAIGWILALPAQAQQPDDVLAKGDNITITYKDLQPKLQQVETLFEKRNGRPPNEEEKKEFLRLTIKSEIKKQCLLRAAEKANVDKDPLFQEKSNAQNNDLKAEFFYTKKMNQWSQDIAQENLDKEAEKIASAGKELFLQLASFPDAESVDRIKNGLTYSNSATFETLVNRILQEKALKEGKSYTPKNIDLGPRLEISMDGEMKAMFQGKKAGELVIISPQENESGTYLILYIKEKRAVNPLHPDIQKMAKKALISQRKKEFFQKLYKDYNIQNTQQQKPSS